MKLARLLVEIELLYRSEIRFGVSVRNTVAALVIDYLNSFDTVEPPLPERQTYQWKRGIN